MLLLYRFKEVGRGGDNSIFHLVPPHFQATEAAIDQFTIIVKEYESIAFPPAFYGLGKALVRLHRHSEALDKAKEGLSLLPNYHLPVSLTWPGTTEVIQETLSHNTEVRLWREE